MNEWKQYLTAEDTERLSELARIKKDQLAAIRDEKLKIRKRGWYRLIKARKDATPVA